MDDPLNVSPNHPPYARLQGNTLTLQLHVQPGAKHTRWQGLYGEEWLSLRLAAPPVDGKANQAAIKFVAQSLNLPPSAVTLVRGQTARRKTLVVQGVSAQQVAQWLQSLSL